MAVDLKEISMNSSTRVAERKALRVTLVISSLSSGGAEKVMALMANYWAKDNVSVTLITLGQGNTDFYRLNPKIKRIALDLAHSSRNAFSAILNTIKRVRRLRREIRHDVPDVVISFMDTTNVLCILATLGLRIPVVVEENIDPRHHHPGRVWAVLRKWTYPYAQAVVVLSQELRRWAQSVSRGRAVYVIPNAAPTLTASSGLPDSSFSLRPGRWAVAAGRLVPQKGFDLLIRAFAECADDVPEWSVLILGDGEEMGHLKLLASELGVADRVNFPGRVEEPQQLLRKAHLFILSSRYEGFPMVLLEAMACGLPVISSDCPTGPREIIQDGVDGLLVPPNDVSALAHAMKRLMLNDEERRRLSLRAAEVTERFSTERVMGLWDRLVDELTGKIKA